MRTILNFIIDYQGDLFMTFLIGLFAIIGTFLVFWITNRNRFMKYLPGVIMVFAALYKVYTAWLRITGPEGIGDLSLAIKLGVAGLVSFCYALILGIDIKYRSASRKKKVSKIND